MALITYPQEAKVWTLASPSSTLDCFGIFITLTHKLYTPKVRSRALNKHWTIGITALGNKKCVRKSSIQPNSAPASHDFRTLNSTYDNWAPEQSWPIALQSGAGEDDTWLSTGGSDQWHYLRQPDGESQNCYLSDHTHMAVSYRFRPKVPFLWLHLNTKRRLWEQECGLLFLLVSIWLLISQYFGEGGESNNKRETLESRTGS